MIIEIRIANNDNEDFEHEGYYDSINEAVAWLKILKEREDLDQRIVAQKAKQAERSRARENADCLANCDKCVWQFTSCPGAVWRRNYVTGKHYRFCPPGYKFKRDPPDGGYYG